MKKTVFLLFALLVQLSVHAELRSGHFFKSLQDENLKANRAVECFNQWFALPQETEWRKVGERTDKLGMTRIEYRQYVGGVEVEHSQVLLHVKNGRVQTANGTVMETRQTPARLRRNTMMYRNGTPTDMLGRQLYLVGTNDGYRYATKVLSADKSEWVYTDVETGKTLKRIPTRHSITAEPVQVSGKSLYSGEVTMDGALDSESGTYMLCDQQRNIHTLIGATIPSLKTVVENGLFSENFPTIELPFDESELTWEKFNEMFDNGSISITDVNFNTYITRNALYASSSAPTFDSYRFKSITFDRVTITNPESGIQTDIAPTEENPIVLLLNIGYHDTNGMIEQVTDTITSMPVTFDLSTFSDEIPLAGADIDLYSIQYIYNENGQTIGVNKIPLAGLRLVPNASCSENWSADHVSASCVYEKNQPWSAVDIHWGMEKTYDYFLDVFGRDSYDGMGSPIYNLFYLPQSFGSDGYMVYSSMNNAAAMYKLAYPFMVYGMGNHLDYSAMNPVVELSVMAHEFTHMVTGKTANLVYQGESGALNESFSDLLGISVKKYVQGNDSPWTIADDVMVNFSNMRSMSFPKESMDGLSPCPDTYKGQYWFDTESQIDNGGVHTNSGVQNKWYYLITDGDTGTNDNGYTYEISGMGIEKSQQIAYRTLVEYATEEAQYADICLASIQATKDLYGNNSNEMKIVQQAWKAVGVSDGTTTDIRETAHTTTPTQAVYDLQGRPVSSPRHGLYISNGRKVVVR